MIEKETKYKAPKIVDINVFIQKLQSEFGGKITKENQLDEYFDTPELRLTNLKRGLRLRNKSILEFKSLFFDGLRYLVEEIEIKNETELEILLIKRLGLPKLSLAEINKIKSLDIQFPVLSHYGLAPQQIVDKHRLNLNLESLILSLDKVKGLPVHIEIEGDNDKLKDALEEFIRKLTILEPSGTIGYVNLLYDNDPRILKSVEFQKRFLEQFDWNVLSTEKDLVKSLFA
jgi:adenylate cyclase class IV